MIKLYLFLILAFTSTFLYSQDYQYKIKIKDVNTLAEAKLVTDPLRENFYTYPYFNENEQQFVFRAKEKVNEDRVVAMMVMVGYELVQFSRTEITIDSSTEKPQ